MAKNLFSLSLVILLIVSLLAGSCGPKTRTITPLSQADRTRIKKVAIHVQADDELEANISKMKTRFVDSNSCIGGIECLLMIPVLIVAAIVEESVRSDIDNKKADEFREDISDIKMDKLIAERINEYFETSDAGFNADITVLQSPSVLAQNGYDTLLDITIKKFEVKLCPKLFVKGVSYQQKGAGPLSPDVIELEDAIKRWNDVYPKYTRMEASRLYGNRTVENLYSIDTKDVSKEKTEEFERLKMEIEELSPVIAKYPRGDSVRTWITFQGKMISTRDNRVIWDREELYYDPKCENVEDMQNNPKIVVDMMTRAIHDIAVNTVNEIQ